MPGNSRFCTFALIFTFTCVGCNCTQRLDPPANKTIDCIVPVEAYDATGTHRGSAAGIVLHHDGERTYILTARHVLYFDEPFKPEDWGLPPLAIIIGATRKILLAPRVVFGIGHVKGEMVWESIKLDAAVFHVARISRPAVEYWEKPPPWSATALAVGMIYPYKLMMHFDGRYQGMVDGQQVFSTHAHAGCSGGGVFVYTDGKWALSGLIVAIGVNGPGLLLHHVTYAVPIYRIAKAIEGGASSPPEAAPPNPLPIDILQEF